MSKSENEAPALPVINVAKIATASSLSGLSSLGYVVGYEPGYLDRIFFKIISNTGGGKFSPNLWVALSSIEKALANVPADGTFTAAALAPIAEGKSVNTSSFIGAALLAEGLIVRSEKVARSYERNPNTAEWWSSLRALVEAGTNLTVTPMDKPVGHTGGVDGKGKPAKKRPAVALATAVN
jgi:hypothetical protein